MNKKLILGATLGVLLPAAARADFTFRPVGLAYDNGDWVQGFLLVSAQEFENVGLVLTRQEGDDRTSGFSRWDFESAPGKNKDNFVATMLTSELGTAEGDNTHQLTWDMHFTGDRENQRFVLTLFAYDDGATSSAVQSAVLNWDGETWNVRSGTGVTWEQFQAALGDLPPDTPVIPAPSALLLGALGLAMVGAVARRRPQ